MQMAQHNLGVCRAGANGQRPVGHGEHESIAVIALDD
jgi:hypothetical protein